MDDEVTVSVRDSIAYLSEQVQPLRHGEHTRIGVSVERLSLNDLDHEVGPAVLGDTSVEDRGEIGVAQRGQDLPLRADAGRELV